MHNAKLTRLLCLTGTATLVYVYVYGESQHTEATYFIDQTIYSYASLLPLIRKKLVQDLLLFC